MTILAPKAASQGSKFVFDIISKLSNLFLPSSIKFILNIISPWIPHFSPLTLNFFPGNIPLGILTDNLFTSPPKFKLTSFVLPLKPSSNVIDRSDS